MNHEIIAEGFQLTPSIKEQGQNCFKELEVLLPKDTSFHLYLSKVGPQSFVARFQVRLLKNTLYTESHDADLYKAMKTARTQLKRQILESLEKKRDYPSKKGLGLDSPSSNGN